MELDPVRGRTEPECLVRVGRGAAQVDRASGDVERVAVPLQGRKPAAEYAEDRVCPPGPRHLDWQDTDLGCIPGTHLRAEARGQ